MTRISALALAIIINMFLPRAVAGVCPYKECFCEDTVIECGNMNLQAMPALVVPQVSWQPYLVLSKNNITTISNGSIPAGIEGFEMQDNPLTSIDQFAFRGSETTLTTIILSGLTMEECPFALFYLKNLKYLTITNSHIGKFDISMFYALGNNLLSLTLIDVGFTEWPSWMSALPRVTNLEFSSAKVSIPSDSFRKSSYVLTSLSLKNLTLTSMGILFEKLGTLRDLILDNNLISEISGLPSPGNLTVLSMNNNSLSDRTNLSHSLRPVADSLTSLYIEDNRLTTFPDLSYLTKMYTFDVNRNLISSVITGAIPASLNFLEIESNRLTSISAFLRNGINLQEVRLGYNRIIEIHGDDLPATVSTLYLSHNLISYLGDTSFPPKSSLSTLQLDFNPISSISISAFSSLTSLTYLSMMSSRLTRLPLAVDSLPQLVTVDLSNTDSLVCTCQERSLAWWVIDRAVRVNGMCGRTTVDFFLRTLSLDCPD